MTTPDSTSDRQLHLAEMRTEASRTRTVLAEERTFSAWLRTGLAALATGVAIVKLMADAGPDWLIRLLGVIFIVAGGCMFILGFYAYQNALRHMDRAANRGIPLWVLAGLSSALFLGAVVGLAIILLE